MRVFEPTIVRINGIFLTQLETVCKQWSVERLKESLAGKCDLSVIDTSDKNFEMKGNVEDLSKVKIMLESYLTCAQYGHEVESLVWPMPVCTETQTDETDHNKPSLDNEANCNASTDHANVKSENMEISPVTGSENMYVGNHSDVAIFSMHVSKVSVETQTDQWSRSLSGVSAEIGLDYVVEKYKRKKMAAKKANKAYIRTGRPRGRPRKDLSVQEPHLAAVKSEPEDMLGDTGDVINDTSTGDVPGQHQFSDVEDIKEEGIVIDENTPRSRSGRPVRGANLSENALGGSDMEIGADDDDDADDDEPISRRRRLRKNAPRKSKLGFYRPTVVGNQKRGRGRPRIYQPGEKYKCDQCDYVSKSVANLKNHEKRVHNVRAFQCEFCDKSFGLNGDLQRHIKSHTEISVCDVCGKNYKTPSQLVKHRAKHDPNYVQPDPIPCEICGKMLMGKTSLRNHMEIIHKGKRKSFLCTTCGKSCPSRAALEDHENQHTGKRPYICSICGATFPQRSTLQSHHLVHTDERNFTCTICGKAFRTKSALKVHEPIHTGDKRFKCDQCGRGFHQKQALERHYRIHTGERPFKCEICGDKFNDASILKRHLMGIHKITGPPGTPGRKVKRISIDGGTVQEDESPTNLSIEQIAKVSESTAPVGGHVSNSEPDSQGTTSSRDQPAFPGLIAASYPLYHGGEQPPIPHSGQPTTVPGQPNPPSGQHSHPSGQPIPTSGQHINHIHPSINSAGPISFYTHDHMPLPLNIPPGTRPPNIYHW